MKIGSINQVNYTPKVKNYAKAAQRGALATTVLLGVTTTASMINQPNEMAEVIKKCGGRLKYAQTFIKSALLLSALASVFSVSCAFIADKISPKKNPKAVN